MACNHMNVVDMHAEAQVDGAQAAGTHDRWELG